MSRLPYLLDNRLTDGGKVVSLTRRPRFTPRKFPRFDLRAIVPIEGLDKLNKNPMILSGFEPETFPLIA
jgi:hypothetical protein